MRHYCTLFDANYLPNFLALYHSLEAQNNGLKIYAFCMDDSSFDYLVNYSSSIDGRIKCVSLVELLKEFPELSDIKKQRSIVEFYFTCSSFITTYVMHKNAETTHVTYLDADLLFFDSPEEIFKELGVASVGIIAHKFFGRGKKYLKYGTYNVGWVTFKNDEQGKACLKSWRENCEDWCFDYYDEENERFGDQKYLDNWEREFKGVKVIQQKGANLAPWNAGQYDIRINKDGKLYVDEFPLVFYHFASFKKVVSGVYTTNLSLYLSRPSNILKNKIYKVYLDLVSSYAELINTETAKVEAMKKNRVAIKQSAKQKLNKLFTSAIRWYFNDYIYK
jgi:uncharacterized protein YdcH (DUF465 family)